jgi:hypothetical protein
VGMADTEGRIDFNVSISVGIDEFATWEVERIRRFFTALAQVMDARFGKLACPIEPDKESPCP